jgi:hypothetical protein
LIGSSFFSFDTFLDSKENLNSRVFTARVHQSSYPLFLYLVHVDHQNCRFGSGAVDGDFSASFVEPVVHGTETNRCHVWRQMQWTRKSGLPSAEGTCLQTSSRPSTTLPLESLFSLGFFSQALPVAHDIPLPFGSFASGACSLVFIVFCFSSSGQRKDTPGYLIL